MSIMSFSLAPRSFGGHFSIIVRGDLCENPLFDYRNLGHSTRVSAVLLLPSEGEELGATELCASVEPLT